MSHLTHFWALSGGGCKPDHRGLEPLTQTRAAQTAALEVTAFSAMDAPFVGISNAGANRFNLVFPGISAEYPLITERAETVLKIKEIMATAGWDCLLERKLRQLRRSPRRSGCRGASAAPRTK